MSNKLKRLHVNQHVIRRNRQTGEREPVITCKSYNDNLLANELIILDKDGNEVARLVYRPDDPLPCGAVCWLETYAEVRVESPKQKQGLGKKASALSPMTDSRGTKNKSQGDINGKRQAAERRRRTRV